MDNRRRPCDRLIVRALCPAKINLDLRVGPLASDGFHPLRSWMVTVGLFDTLDVSLDTAGRLQLTCSDPALACDASNLVLRAALLLREHATATRQTRLSGGPRSDVVAPLPGAQMDLHKRIPSGGGLGGGSSDAAATLAALNALWKLDLAGPRLSELAAGLGSDVPFFLNGPSSLCTGRGDITRPVPPPACRWAVLILPDIAMPTPAVYRQFDARQFDAARAARGVEPHANDAWQQKADYAQWATLSAEDLLQRLGNDLEPPAFTLRPDLADLHAVAERSLGRPVRMSGSGSTLFSLFNTQRESLAAVKRLNDEPGVRSQSVRIAPDGSDGFDHIQPADK